MKESRVWGGMGGRGYRGVECGAGVLECGEGVVCGEVWGGCDLGEEHTYTSCSCSCNIFNFLFALPSPSSSLTFSLAALL